MAHARPILPSALTRHPLAAAGAVLTTVSAVLCVLFWIAESVGWLGNAYLGLLTFVLLPALFVLGLLLMPVGLWLARRRARRGLPVLAWPTLDLNDARVRGWVLLGVLATIVNTLLVGVASVEAVHYMDSPTFCGAVCHTPMEPHFVQWQRGPLHTRVACASCHIGTGATGFVTAKARGTAQLLHVIAGNYPRPVPSPVAHRPAAGLTCGACHEAKRQIGERGRVFTDIAADQANTATQTRLTLLVGGTQANAGPSGIHWHASPSVEVDYIALDQARATIPWVRVRTPDGQVKEYAVDGFDAASGGQRRRMDCVDCHNKVAHPFAASAERVVDRALAEGRLDSRLPYLRREAVRVLNGEYRSREHARAAIVADLAKFYAASGEAGRAVEQAAVRTASDVLTDLHASHVFPAMRVTFGTYVSNNGHTDAPGCFRCHDDQHKARDGSVIKQDCETCHREDAGPATQ